MSSVQAESRPDLAELKKAVQKKLRARGELRNDRPRPFSPEGAPPQTPDAAVAQLIREKDELLAALDEQRARADGLQAEAAAARAQPSPPGNADKERELLDENEALKRTIGSLTGRVSELEVTAAAAGQAGEKLAALLLERERDAASLAAHAEAERTARDALADLERRLGDATRQVEALNNEAVGLRENVAAARQERDEANERSLMLEKSIEMLETKVRNLTVREDLALTWKSKTEKLASENNRLLEERSELQGKLAELASSNASLTLALDTAQRHLAAQTDSPDPSPRLAARKSIHEDANGRIADAPTAGEAPVAAAGDEELRAQLQALAEQNVRLAEELAKEREISERLSAQVDEIPGFIVKFVEQRQRALDAGSIAGLSNGDADLSAGPDPAASAPSDTLSDPSGRRVSLRGRAHPQDFSVDMYHCPACYEAQEVFL